MKLPAALFRRLPWFNLSSAVLLAVLQRAPLLRVGATAGDFVLRSPAAALLKSTIAAVSALGAVHSLAGATTLSSSAPSPAAATVGTSKTIAYGIIGSETQPLSWTLGGTVPPGMTYTGGATGGIVNTPSGVLILSGTPTTAGTYPITLKAWEFANGTGISSNTFNYTVVVSGGSATAPAFTTQPTSQTVTAGANVTFAVAAIGSPTPTLQWQKNTVAIAGQTGATLSLSNVQAADTASYRCVATNSAGPATSNAATLTVNAAAVAPAFSTQPAAQTALPGANVTFTVAATGSPTPTLQWQKNGAPIAGQTGTSLTLNPVTAADVASYTCVATNTTGSITSAAAALTLNAAAPAFTTQPASQAVNSGVTVNFTVVATGLPTPTLQWRKNGTALSGQTSTGLSLVNVQTADAGSYTCVATNASGSATSTAAALTINAVPVPDVAPVFTAQPAAQTSPTGGNVTFSVAVTGSPTPALQWRKDGAALLGQISSSLSLANVQFSDAASYTCTAKNSVGSVTSVTATLTVNPPVAAGPESRISNVSVRTTLAAAQTLIVGFTMQGGSKLVLLRAVGPGLANFGVPGTMDDPKLLLFKEAAMLTQNDDWGGGGSLSNAFASVGAFPLTPSSHDAALMRNVEGGHTAQVSGPAGGNVLVEAYDAGTGMAPRLSNVSARNIVGTGADILIAGITVAGTTPKNLLIRAVGPTLAVFGVPGTLVDPKLTIYNSAGTIIATNDNWSASLASTFASVGAFALAPGSHDAALTITLPPGGYTVQVSGADGGTGEALVELYELP